MKKLAFGLLTLGMMTQASGCIIVSDDEEGYFEADWVVLPDGTTCADVGGDTVSILSTDSFGDGYEDLFDCADLGGRTSPLPVDTFTVSVGLLDANGNSLLVEPITLTNQTIHHDGQVVPLPVFEFDFSRAITFAVDYGTAGGNNCSSGGANDNGVVLQEVAIMDGSSCIPLYIYFDGDNNQCGASGDSACLVCGTGSDALALCQPSTVQQMVYGLPLTGTFDLAIYGYKGAVSGDPVLCYQSSQSFTLAGADLELGVISVPFDPAPADEADCNATKPAAH